MKAGLTVTELMRTICNVEIRILFDWFEAYLALKHMSYCSLEWSNHRLNHFWFLIRQLFFVPSYFGSDDRSQSTGSIHHIFDFDRFLLSNSLALTSPDILDWRQLLEMNLRWFKWIVFLHMFNFKLNEWMINEIINSLIDIWFNTNQNIN